MQILLFLFIRWRSSCSSLCLPSAYLSGLPSSPSFWAAICFLWQECLSVLHFQIHQCSRCFSKPSMATFPAFSQINLKTSPLFISSRTFVFLLEHFLFLTLRKLVREGILGIIWFYLISLRRWVSWNSGGDEMHPNLWSKWGVQSEPKPGSGLLAQNSHQDTPEPLKTACPMVDAVSFCCSAVTSWRAGTVAYFSKFSPVAWPICSRHTWLLNWAWRGKQNWKTGTILSQMLAECFFICCLSSVMMMMMMMMTMMMMMCVCMCVCVLAAQLCLTLFEPMNCSLPGSSVHGILQARTLEWIAIPFFRGSSPPRDRTQVSCIAGRFFTVWATREAFPMIYPVFKIQGQHGFITFPIHFKWTFLRFPVSFAE